MKFFLSEKGSGIAINGDIPDGGVECTSDQISSGYAVVDGVLTAPTDAQLLERAQAEQKKIIRSAYNAAVYAEISYKSSGMVDASYQADAAARTNIARAQAAYASGVPDGYYWLSADNTQVTFTFADLSGLLSVISSRDWEYFKKLQTLKAEIAAATTIDAVKAVVWGD